MTKTTWITKCGIGLATLLTFSVFGSTFVMAQTPGQPPASSVGLAGNSLQQIAVTTADLQRAIVFYRDVLGLPFLFETNGMAFFDVAGVRLMVALDPERPSTRPTSIIYFGTDTFDLTVEKLKQLKLPLEGPVETVQRTSEGWLRLQQFRDPDGNALAVMGVVPHSETTDE